MKLVVKKNDDKDSRQGVGINQPTDHFKAATYVVNEVIEGKCCHWKRFYRGTVKKVNKDGTYEVHFDDGEVRRKFSPLYMHKVKFSNKERPKKQKPKKQKPKRQKKQKSKVKYEIGQAVEGKCCGWTKFYKGAVLEDNGDDTYKIVFDDGEVRKRFKSIYLRAVSTNAKTVSHKGSKIDASEPNSESSLDASLLGHDKTKKANVKTASHKASKADANEHNSESSFDASLVDDIYAKKLMKETASLVQDGIISKAQAEAFLQQEMAKLYAVHGKKHPKKSPRRPPQ